MRWVIYALFVLAFAPRALADDFDVLRGSQPIGPATFTRWSGFYFGGQVGYSDANANFANSTQAPLAYLLRETLLESEIAPSQWPVLGRGTQSGPTFGGFAGFNTQWQDLVLGVEADYEQASLRVVAPSSPVARLYPADSSGNTFDVLVSANGTIEPIEYGSLRARAGLVLGNFLPYAFIGGALGQANFTLSANVQGTECNSHTGCVPFNLTSSTTRQGALIYGVVAGGGVDVALLPNVFLRGELEYVEFTPLSGVVSGIASAHVGAGIKF